MRKPILIGLDRDGTINDDPGYTGKDINWKRQVRLLPSVIEGLKELKKEPNARIIVASNQAGVARNYFDCERVKEVNRYLAAILQEQEIRLNGWYYCPYVGRNYAREKNLPFDNPWVKETCLRKPGIGMLKQACKDLGLSLEETPVYFIGDKADDVQTGLNAKGKGILVRGGEGENDLEKVKSVQEQNPSKVFIAANLLDAARWIRGDITRGSRRY